MLGNLFDATRDALPLSALRQRDRYMPHQLSDFARLVETAHDERALGRVVTSALALVGGPLRRLL